jgi:glucokinase
VANLINIFNPEVIVLGGGVIEALEDEMLGVIIETANESSLAGTAKGISIVASKLADEAGITGGAVLARRECK